ncbi:lysophospholipid acyltransferase family protein [Hyalangium sp.]|uniref:lysophospholipid acyltransferase family protein n=1 Tax=Hyalangium sp. TaxID=2028555 RepID=UPI002D404CAA|nr:lysophospholipid acyltransferase family protein [Hyalangium sp.]HYH95465.1 lysophospholipid acyltransferase family protein [Hyalangium sp.]
MNALLSIWTWLEIALMSLVGFCVQLVLAVLTWPFDRRRVITGRCFRLVAVVSSKLTPYWRFGVHGPVPERMAPRTVVVSNHESNADPFLISFLPWEMKWLGKASLFKIPVVGWSMWLAGDIPVTRGDQDSAKDAMARCVRWLEKGMPVMIFPEGTRSKTEELLPFKDGAFRLAIETGADVLPLAVSGTRRALPKHSWRFATAKGLVTVGTPISTQGMTLADVERLKALAREQILALRASLLPLTNAGPGAEEGARAA